MSDQAKLVSLVSFAVQQLLQLLDPFLPQSLGANANLKKAVMGMFSFGLGLILEGFLYKQLNVLQSGNEVVDFVGTALIIGAGTEASNTVQKLLSYTKDKIKGAAGGAPAVQH